MYTLTADGLPIQWGLPLWLATALKLVLRFLVAGLGFYMLGRHLGAATRPALFGGLLFSLAESSVQQAHLLSYSALPALVLILRTVTTRSRSWLATTAFTALAVGGWTIVSHGHSALVALPWVMLGTLWRLPSTLQRRAVGTLSLFVCWWVLAQSQFFWALYLNGALSQRGNPTYQGLAGLDPAAVLGPLRMTGVPLALIMAAAAMALTPSFRGNLKRDLLFLLLLVLAALLGLIVYPPIRSSLARVLPMAGTFPFERIVLGLPLCTTLIGTFSWQLIEEQCRPALRKTILSLGVAVLVCLPGPALARQLWWMAQGVTFRALYEQPSVQALQQLNLFGKARLATVARRIGPYGCFQPAFCWAYGLETADGYSSIYTQRYRQFWELVTEPCTRQNPDLELYLRKSTFNRVYVYPNPHSNRLADTVRLNLLSLANVKYIILDQTTAHPFVDAEEQGLAVLSRTNANWRERGFRERIDRLMQGHVPDAPLLVYENSSVFPRAFFVSGAQQFASANELFAALREASPDDLRRNLFCLAEDLNDPSVRPAAAVSLSSLSTTQAADRIVSEFSNHEAGYLVVATNFHPFWTCRLDAELAPVIPAYHTFMAVPVKQPGAHKIEFTYRPPYRTAY